MQALASIQTALDALRAGRARERELARKLLGERLQADADAGA